MNVSVENLAAASGLVEGTEGSTRLLRMQVVKIDIESAWVSIMLLLTQISAWRCAIYAPHIAVRNLSVSLYPSHWHEQCSTTSFSEFAAKYLPVLVQKYRASNGPLEVSAVMLNTITFTCVSPRYCIVYDCDTSERVSPKPTGRTLFASVTPLPVLDWLRCRPS